MPDATPTAFALRAEPTENPISLDTPTATHPGVPAAPTGLRLTTLPDGRLQLDWDTAPDVDAWDVLDLVNTATPVKETVTVPRSIRTALSAGSHRRYAIRARNTAGDSPLSDPLDVPATAAPSHPTGPTEAPGHLLDLSRWFLTLPIADPGGHDTSGPWDIHQPELATFTPTDYFHTVEGPAVEYIAPVKGVPTHGSHATRCELQEQIKWSLDDHHPHTLTCTLTCDGTSIAGRKEVIVGQIHGPGGTPPLILCLNHSRGGALEVFRQGPRQGDLLTGLAPGELFTYRIDATGGRLRLWATRGQANQLHTTPKFDWPVSVLTEHSKLYFKAGAYNKQEIGTATTGAAIVRHHHLDLV
jgi:hypothetical protein